MNSTCIAILTNPHPCGHIVYPCKDEELFIEALCLYTRAGLREGESVIFVMTDAHCQAIATALAKSGYDVADLTKLGRLLFVKADDLLHKFMSYGMPDADLFEKTAGELIRLAKKRSHERRVRVFREMVALLWEQNLTAAIRLEKLWNEIIEQEQIPLMCTYTLRKNSLDVIPPSIACLHSHSVSNGRPVFRAHSFES